MVQTVLCGASHPAFQIRGVDTELEGLATGHEYHRDLFPVGSFERPRRRRFRSLGYPARAARAGLPAGPSPRRTGGSPRRCRSPLRRSCHRRVCVSSEVVRVRHGRDVPAPPKRSWRRCPSTAQAAPRAPPRHVRPQPSCSAAAQHAVGRHPAHQRDPGMPGGVQRLHRAASPASARSQLGTTRPGGADRPDRDGPPARGAAPSSAR